MIGENGDRFDSTYVRGFMDRFPTPLDFEGSKSNFLKMIKDHNPDAKYQEYVRDMDKFCRDMYGKRQEYYERLQELNAKASERNVYGYAAEEPKTNVAETMEIERNPFSDMGGMITPKSWLIGEGSNKPSEDSAYFDNNGVMALFDGVGGSANGAAASTACVNALPSLMQQINFSDPMEREKLTRLLRDEVSPGDSTTCVVTKTEKNSDGTSMLHYVALGDSRLYVIRNNKAYQITRDDNVTEEMLNRSNITDPKTRKQFLQHGISKQLGGPYNRPSAENNGTIKLYPGDKIMLCSDGITGDLSEDKMDAEDYAMGKRPDVMTNEEIAQIICSSRGCQDAAAQLSQRAKKIDDRSVLWWRKSSVIIVL